MEPGRDDRILSSEHATFDQLANERSPGVLREMGAFLLHNKKWWLIPIVVVLLLVGALLALGASGAAPFIYTLF